MLGTLLSRIYGVKAFDVSGQRPEIVLKTEKQVSELRILRLVMT